MPKMLTMPSKVALPDGPHRKFLEELFAHYREAGADVVLVGEALVTNDPVSTLHAFLEAGS